MHEPTHASFFSGVGGLDLGLERAGWRTVSFSEIDPYASAVLAERWPGVPNLGDIINIGQSRSGVELPAAGSQPDSWQSAALWSGGFPCQDLSVAGKRRGFGLRTQGQTGSAQAGVESGDASRLANAFDTDTRSGLAFAFLDLVERHRPPAILLENVPGLLSSHRGRDFGTLLDRLAQLGYGWAYRILDARHFGVPQRRRRVFIVALDTQRGLGAERAAAVLSVGSRCGRHPATGHQTGEGAAERTTVGAIPAGVHGFPDGVQEFMQGHFRVQPQLGASPDPSGVRAPDGLAGRVDGDTVGPILSSTQGGQRTTDLNTPLVYRKRARPTEADGSESWVDDGLANTLNAFDTGDIRSTHIALGEGPQDDPLLPLGLDSHRYRCCGNGVVSSVAEWIGFRLKEALS